MINRMEKAIDLTEQKRRVKVFLVGLAKHSQVLQRYSLVMHLEDLFPKGEPRYAKVPFEIEEKSYTWQEFVWKPDEAREGKEETKYSKGIMHLVRFGVLSGIPERTQYPDGLQSFL